MQHYYFEDLSASAENIHTINKMIYQRWWQQDYDFQTVETYLQQQIYQAKHGKVRLLFDQDQQFLGFYCFSHFNIEDYEQVPFWLSYVFVKPEHRQQDLGRILIQEAQKQASLAGQAQLFILTDKQTQYYQKLGCQVVDYSSYLGRKISIMCADLRDCYPPAKVQATLSIK